MRVLITGSAGFIGRHLAAASEEQGWIVDRCDPKHPDLRLNDHAGYVWNSDCRGLFAPLVTGAPIEYDLVFHCAATVGGRVGIDENAAFLGANNFQLDGAMFEWALNARPGRVVYFSSAASYPKRIQHIRGRASVEGDAYPGATGEPDESYGWVKLMGEMLAKKVRKAGVPVTVVRPFSSYGFDQDEADYPFPAIIRRAARRESPFVVWGDGTQTRDFIHVEDLVSATLALVEAEVDGPVNLGTGIGTSMDELARICMEEAGYEAPIRHLLDKPVGVDYRVCDNTLLREYYEPQITIQEGVRRALEAVGV